MNSKPIDSRVRLSGSSVDGGDSLHRSQDPWKSVRHTVALPLVEMEMEVDTLLEQYNPIGVARTEEAVHHHKKLSEENAYLPKRRLNDHSVSEDAGLYSTSSEKKKHRFLRDWGDNVSFHTSTTESDTPISLTTSTSTPMTTDNSFATSSTSSCLSRASASIRSAGATIRSLQLQLTLLSKERHQQYDFHQTAAEMMERHAIELQHFQQMEREARHQAEDALRREVVAALASNQQMWEENQALAVLEARRIREQIQRFHISRGELMETIHNRKGQEVHEGVPLSSSVPPEIPLNPSERRSWSGLEGEPGDKGSNKEVRMDITPRILGDGEVTPFAEALPHQHEELDEENVHSLCSSICSPFKEEKREVEKAEGEENENSEKKNAKRSRKEVDRVEQKRDKRNKIKRNEAETAHKNDSSSSASSLLQRVADPAHTAHPSIPSTRPEQSCGHCGTCSSSCAGVLPPFSSFLFHPACMGNGSVAHIHEPHFHCPQPGRGSWVIPAAVLVDAHHHTHGGFVLPSSSPCCTSPLSVSNWVPASSTAVPGTRHLSPCRCCGCDVCSSSPYGMGPCTSVSCHPHMEKAAGSAPGEAVSFSVPKDIGQVVGEVLTSAVTPPPTATVESRSSTSPTPHSTRDTRREHPLTHRSTPITTKRVKIQRHGSKKGEGYDRVWRSLSESSFSQLESLPDCERERSVRERRKSCRNTKSRPPRRCSSSASKHRVPFLPCGPSSPHASEERKKGKVPFSRYGSSHRVRHAPPHRDRSPTRGPPPLQPYPSTWSGCSPVVPWSHHVDGIHSTAQHFNLLYPREYHRRRTMGCEPADITDTIYASLRASSLERKRDTTMRKEKRTKEDKREKGTKEYVNQQEKSRVVGDEENDESRDEGTPYREKQIRLLTKKRTRKQRGTHRRCPTCTPETYFYPSRCFPTGAQEVNAVSPSSAFSRKGFAGRTSGMRHPRHTLASSPAARKRTLSIQRVMKEVHRERQYCDALYACLKQATPHSMLWASSCVRG